MGTGRRNNHAQRSTHRSAAERAADRREAACLIQELAKPVAPREQVTAWISRAAGVVSFERSRAEDIWRQEARRIEAWEMDALRAAVRAHLRRRPR